MKNSLDNQDIPYEEKHGYINPMEDDERSDRATRIIKFVIGCLLALLGIAIANEWI